MRQKRPSVWELRVYLGRDTKGRVRHKTATFHGAKREAQRELARMVSELEQNDAEIPLEWGPGTTINDAIEAWQRNGWEDLSPYTVRRYESIWRIHIRDTIGRRRIKSLGPYEVEQFLRQLKRQGQSRSSVHQARAMLHRACRLARKWSGNRLPNPVADTELPEWGLHERSEEVRAPEPEEVHTLLRCARGHDLRVAVFLRLVAATGMRRGEACALRWSDVEWEAGAVRIDEAIVGDRGGIVVRGPKNRSSIRRVAVDAGTLEELRVLLAERKQIAEACRVQIDESAFVFSTEPSGSVPAYPDAMTHAFTRIRDLAGLPADIHLHSLRHFHSTRLDPVISEAQKQARMGWATVQMARHYTDAIREEDRRAAEHMGQVLGEPVPAPVGATTRRSAVRYRQGNVHLP